MINLKYIVVIFALLISNITVSQTLHGIIFADTWNDEIGYSVKRDFGNMEIEFILIAETNNLKLNLLIDCVGEDFNKQTADNVLNNLMCEPNDIVFFYYSGHGRRSDSQFPQLALDGGGIALHTIDEMIAKKNPRLRIIMADCCNGATSEDLTPQGDLGGASQLDRNSESFYKNLFGNSVRGSVMVASSRAGEISRALNVGGVFIFSLLQEAQKMIASSANANWNTLLERTQNATNKLAGHTPIFAVNIEKISTTPATVTQRPSSTLPTPPPPASFDEALAQLVDSKVNIDYRIDLIQQTLNEYFTPNAVVRIYGRNGTLVRRETAENFLRRIAISHNLIRLVQQDFKKAANDKYTEVSFHEIYSSN